MAIDPLPTPPSRQDPSNFSDRADAYLGAFPLWTQQANQLGADMNAAASAAAASAASALNAPGTSATSSTQNTIGLGAVSFQIQTGKALSVGQTLVAAATAGPLNQMVGRILSYNAGTGALSMLSELTSGSGTYTAWTISMAATAFAASGADILAGTSSSRFVTPAGLMAAAASRPLTFSSSLQIDLTQGLNFHTTVTGNFTLSFTGGQNGDSGRIRLVTGGSGNPSMALASGIEFYPSGVPGLPAAVGAVAIIAYFINADGVAECTLLRSA